MSTLANLPELDGLRIERRSERPMMVALAAIVLAWSIAFALTLM